MKLLRLIPNNTNFDFLRIKVIAFFFSLIILSVTLMIGIATSMFTAIVITKYIVFLYSKKKDINSVFLQD